MPLNNGPPQPLPETSAEPSTAENPYQPPDPNSYPSPVSLPADPLNVHAWFGFVLVVVYPVGALVLFSLSDLLGLSRRFGNGASFHSTLPLFTLVGFVLTLIGLNYPRRRIAFVTLSLFGLCMLITLVTALLTVAYQE